MKNLFAFPAEMNKTQNRTLSCLFFAQILLLALIQQKGICSGNLLLACRRVGSVGGSSMWQSELLRQNVK